nr:Retrovirus-related Pol polyprotein from transposon RE2 [Ipomoea batatas]
MKHLALDYFFVRELVTSGTLVVRHIPSSAQLDDILTKPLGRHLFLHFRSKIGVSDGSSILRGRVKDICG